MKNETKLMAFWISDFLTKNLIENRNLSINTQRSYRDVFLLLTRYIEKKHRIEMLNFKIDDFNSVLVQSFLDYLFTDLGSSASTCNQRLAAIKSFTKFVSRSYPDFLKNATGILSIGSKKVITNVIDYLSKEEVEEILRLPDKSTDIGYRDYLLLLMLYNTGARASEIANLKIDEITFGDQCFVLLKGKGKKERVTPLWKKTGKLIQDYIRNNAKITSGFLFYGTRHNVLTRHGIYEIVQKYACLAKQKIPSLSNKKITPHTFRHTTAVHLLLAGIDINTIRAWLGHSSIETTNIYASITLEMKQKAIDKCSLKSAQSKAIWKTKSFSTFLKNI